MVEGVVQTSEAFTSAIVDRNIVHCGLYSIHALDIYDARRRAAYSR
jgi:hypothetical protein